MVISLSGNYGDLVREFGVRFEGMISSFGFSVFLYCVSIRGVRRFRLVSEFFFIFRSAYSSFSRSVNRFYFKF